MVHDSMRNLRFDSRLRRRRGWITDAELQAELDALPDVADNAEIVSDEAPEKVAAPPPAPELR